MPIYDNFPKKIPVATPNRDGLLSKSDKRLLDSLENKKNSLMETIGRKIHTFDTINSMVSATNLAANETVFVLGSETVLDDSQIRIYLISSDSTPIGDGSVLHLTYCNLYAKFIMSMKDGDNIDEAIAEVSAELDVAKASVNARIANILANTNTDTPTEVVDARLDENNVAYACLKDRLDALGIKVSNAAIKRYGVTFTGSSSTGTRLDDAIDLIAEASTDSARGTNDFDSIYPWSDIVRCNGYYTELGGFVVTAYDGEPGFALDGSNGNVWVEIPKFYIREVIDGDTESMYVSGTRLDGYRLPEKFIRANGTSLEKVYIAAYGLSDKGSVSGVSPIAGNYTSLLNTCKSIGDNHCGFTVDDYELIRFLFTVEYATRNSQKIMTGAAALCTGNTVTVTATTSNTNNVIVKRTSESLKLAVSQIFSIYSEAGILVVGDRVISAITRCDNTGAQSDSGDYLLITFNGDPITIAAGCYINNGPWMTGATNAVLGPTGSLISNTLGIYPCRYRYIENPWGNQWTILYQVLCENGTIKYSKDIDGEYIYLGYGCPTQTGYISSLGYDPKALSCRFANKILGGSSSTFYTDNFITNNGVNERQVAVGGALTDGITSVGLYALNTAELKTADTKFGTRLSYNY